MTSRGQGFWRTGGQCPAQRGGLGGDITELQLGRKQPVKRSLEHPDAKPALLRNVSSW